MHLRLLTKDSSLVACLTLATLLFVPHGCRMTTLEEAPQETVVSEREQPDTIILEPEIQEQLGLQFDVAERRKLSWELHLTGVVEPNARRVAAVRAVTGGLLQSVYVTIGDRVEAGQMLATYDNIELGDLLAQRAAAMAARQRSETEAAVMREAVERAKHLVRTGALAVAEKQRREAAYEQALSRIEEAQAEVDQIEKKIRRLGQHPSELETPLHAGPSSADDLPLLSPIYAPFSGVVMEANAAEGELVDPARILFKIADISNLWVQGDLHEKDIGTVQTGMKVTIRAIAYPDRTFEGQIEYVSDFLDPASRTARVRVEVPNRGFELKIGMFVTIEIPVVEGAAVMAVPVGAVQQINDQPAVFVRRSPDSFDKRILQTGRRGRDWVEVSNGISAGEEVVTEGSFQLKAILLRGSVAEED